MSTREWCPVCGCTRPFEPDEVTPYLVRCIACGHGMTERTRPSRTSGTTWLEHTTPKEDQ